MSSLASIALVPAANTRAFPNRSVAMIGKTCRGSSRFWRSRVNISSAHEYLSRARCPAGDASKTGLLGLTRAMAIDHGPQGIRVNVICPGYIETPMLEKAFSIGAAARAAVLKFHPLGRIGTPADVAEATLFLASDAASFISGAVLAVDGCLTAQGL